MVIPFDPHRFREAAADYLVGRPAYAPRLFERIALLTGLSRAHRVLDLGCGPGQIAIAMAPLAGHVVGIDPEPEMLAHARAAAPGLEWIEGSSYDLPALAPRLAPLHLVTIGRAFHWMDREATVAALDGIVAPGGAIALVRDQHPDVPQNAWHAQLQALTEPIAAADPATAIKKAWTPHAALLLASPFSSLEQIAIVEPRRVSIEALMARTRSRSSVRRGAAALEAEIRALLAPFADAHGVLDEVIESEALIARRSA